MIEGLIIAALLVSIIIITTVGTIIISDRLSDLFARRKNRKDMEKLFDIIIQNKKD